NKKALEVLGKGVTSLGFYFTNCVNISKENIGVLLKDICLEAAEINLVCPGDSGKCSEIFSEFVAEGKWENKNVLASASIDPIGTFILKGKLSENAFSKLKPVFEKTRILPNFRIIAVHGKFFANSGSSIAQELAFSLAIGAEYLTQFTELGLNIDDIAKTIKFNFGIGNNYFMEIAKLRAARLLWAQIVKAYNPESDCSAKLIAHSETNR